MRDACARVAAVPFSSDALLNNAYIYINKVNSLRAYPPDVLYMSPAKPLLFQWTSVLFYFFTLSSISRILIVILSSSLSLLSRNLFASLAAFLPRSFFLVRAFSSKMHTATVSRSTPQSKCGHLVRYVQDLSLSGRRRLLRRYRLSLSIVVSSIPSSRIRCSGGGGGEGGGE